MTPAELESFKVEARFFAIEAVLAAIIQTVASSTPAARKAISESLDRKVNESRRMPVPGTTPEYADMFAAEIQEQFETLASLLKSHLLAVPDASGPAS